MEQPRIEISWFHKDGFWKPVLQRTDSPMVLRVPEIKAIENNADKTEQDLALWRGVEWQHLNPWVRYKSGETGGKLYKS